MAFTYLKVKSAKCLCFFFGGLGLVISSLGLVIVMLVLVLVLRFWSCLHHWYLLKCAFIIILIQLIYAGLAECNVNSC